MGACAQLIQPFKQTSVNVNSTLTPVIVKHTTFVTRLEQVEIM